MEDLVKLYEEAEAHWGDFFIEKERVMAGVAAAGRRARKSTNELTKLFKAFRKVTVDLEKSGDK